MRAEISDVGGPMVGLCAGHRCAALWRLRDPEADDETDPLVVAGPAALRRAIRDTPGGVLTRLPCVGACAEGAVVGVASQAAGSTATGEVAWLVGADAPARQSALVEWLAADWTRQRASAPSELAPALFHMVTLHRAAQS